MPTLTQECVGEMSLVRFRIREDDELSRKGTLVTACDAVTLFIALAFLVRSTLSERSGSVWIASILLVPQLLRAACAHARVCEESMTLMPELGVELSVVTQDGTRRTRFIDWVRVRAIVLFEVFEWNAVNWRIGLVLADDERTAIAFKHLNPRLRTLVTIYRAAHTVLFGESTHPEEESRGSFDPAHAFDPYG